MFTAVWCGCALLARREESGLSDPEPELVNVAELNSDVFLLLSSASHSEFISLSLVLDWNLGFCPCALGQINSKQNLCMSCLVSELTGICQACVLLLHRQIGRV